MNRLLFAFLALAVLTAQTPPAPAPPPTEKKAEPKKPEKAEQEPRPEQQEQQKEDSQKKDAPAPAPAGAATVSPNPITAEGAAEKKEDKKWDVNNPPGPHHEVDIDVTEGTWLSLDVSPDGKEIAFDLLGDIYTIPIGGGEAKPLTSGVAWDMQPRYSPNGKWNACTSARAGVHNS